MKTVGKQVVMLPSNKTANRGDITTFGEKLVIASSVLHLANVSQHLYVLSDEEIKVGDWCIMLDSFGNVFSNPQRYVNPETQHLNKGLRKVIATTDKSLMIGLSNKLLNSDYLPEPSQEFIEHFINEYNQNK